MKAIRLILLLSVVSCARYDATPSYLALLLAGSGQVTTAPWADSVYHYRRKIVFGTSHSALSKGFTPSFTLDTRSSAHVAFSSGDDVRVYWQPTSGAAVSLDRIGSSWNSGSTTIEFRLQSNLAANLNEPTEGYYYVYYGNSSASAAASDEKNVYYFADFFNRADSTTIGNGWTEWNSLPADMTIASGKLCQTGNDTALTPGIKQSFALGTIPGKFTLSYDWTVAGIVQATWVQMVQVGDSATMINTNMTAGVGPAIYFGEGGGITPDILYNMDYRFSAAGQLENTVLPNDAAPTQVLQISMVVDPTLGTYDYYRGGILKFAGATFENAAATLNQIRIVSDNWGAGLTCYAYDNLKLKLNVADDPETTASAEETAP